VKPHGNIFIVQYGGVSNPQKVARLLYKNASIFLERKRDIVNELLSLPIQRVSYDRDENAAKNIRQLGLGNTESSSGINACGEESSGLDVNLSETGLREAGSKHASYARRYNE